MFPHEGVYLGYTIIAKITPSMVKAMAKRLAKDHAAQTTDADRLEIAIFSSALVARPRAEQRFAETMAAASHLLIDLLSVSSVGKLVVLVTNDLDESTALRQARCHAYAFMTKRAASELVSLVSQLQQIGLENVTRAVNGDAVPYTLVNMGDGNGAAGDSTPKNASPLSEVEIFGHLKGYYGKHAPGTKSDDELQATASRVWRTGTARLNAPMSTKYGESFDEYVAGSRGVTTGAVGAMEAKTEAEYFKEIVAFYEKHAPGFKTEADLTRIAERCALQGHAWLDGPLLKKYSESFSEFSIALAARRIKLAAQIGAYYGKHAPGTKSEVELAPVAERCSRTGVEWLDGPLQSKYGESFTSFIASLGAIVSEETADFGFGDGFDDEETTSSSMPDLKGKQAQLRHQLEGFYVSLLLLSAWLLGSANAHVNRPPLIIEPSCCVGSDDQPHHPLTRSQPGFLPSLFVSRRSMLPTPRQPMKLTSLLSALHGTIRPGLICRKSATANLLTTLLPALPATKRSLAGLARRPTASRRILQLPSTSASSRLSTPNTPLEKRSRPISSLLRSTAPRKAQTG